MGIMDKKSLMRYAVFIVKVAIASVFIYAGVMKLRDPSAFLTDISNYKITPYKFSLVLSLFLPWLEIFAAVALFFKSYKPAACLIMTFMLVVFMIAIASAWMRGLDITCGCFGSTEKVSYLSLILRDILFLAAVIFVYVFDGSQKSDSSTVR
jgi:putative oxidoreductase